MTEQSNEARERVLEVAEKLFMTQGFQAVSMRDIADALGVRQSSLYYHAPQGKEQLFFDAAVRSLERHRGQLEAVIAAHAPDFRRQFHAVAQWLVSLDDMDLVRLIRLDLPEISPAYKEQIASALYEMIMAPMADIVRVHQQSGRIRQLDPNVLVGSLLALTAWTNHFNAADAHRVATPGEIRLMVDLLLDGCLAADSPETS